MSSIRPLLVIGTRPEAVKMAPLVHMCLQTPGVDPIVCFTGQHREMLIQTAEYFGIEADVNLDVMRPNQTLAGVTCRCLEGLDSVIAEYSPDYIVAQGDTTTVLSASMAAFYRRIDFVHIEAGLRTHDLYAPWPEEYNRVVTSIATAAHCAPTQRSADNLLAENVDPRRIHITGNTVIDALMWSVERERNNPVWADRYHHLQERRVVLITGHRRENFGGGFDSMCRAIAELAQKFSEVEFVFPVHLNPNVRRPVYERLANLSNVKLMDPVPYPEFVWLMDRAYLILTDSGGVQEEAPSLRKPVLVMRNSTERPEAVEAGAVELVGTSFDRIVGAASDLLTDAGLYASRQIENNPYGDGRAAERIVSLLLTAHRQAVAA